MKTTLTTSKNISVEIEINLQSANTAIVTFPNEKIAMKNTLRETINGNSFLFRNGKSNCVEIQDKGVIDFNAAGGTALVILGWQDFTFKFL